MKVVSPSPQVSPAVADHTVVEALCEAAQESGNRYHVGVLQCKDSFYGQHSPQTMPVAAELEAKWQAWIDCGAKASEMESAALFVVGSVRKVRTGSIMMVFANQTRRALGLDDPMCMDTEPAVRVAVDALRRLILKDRESGKA